MAYLVFVYISTYRKKLGLSVIANLDFWLRALDKIPSYEQNLWQTPFSTLQVGNQKNVSFSFIVSIYQVEML